MGLALPIPNPSTAPAHLDLIIQNPDGPLRFSVRRRALCVRTASCGLKVPPSAPSGRASSATPQPCHGIYYKHLPCAPFLVCRAASCGMKVAAAPPSNSQQTVIAHGVAPCSISSCFAPLHKIGYIVRCFVSIFCFRVQLLKSCNELLN